ncbi:helical backbone metal receptor [uncultured Desulfobulbus sp.]|uniref:ABC transporter substrate-binding protein n=1 Tax=uncultured Desulfobulbus sp. TaxID=239745 RepID=UPI0029C67A7C|nr:helical backbone metal receptor [uncultured Desulfobulbus sp.]
MKRIRSPGTENLGIMSIWFGSVFLLLAVGFIPVRTNAVEPTDNPVSSYDRIVSLGPLITENLFLLGAGDSLVGNTLYCQRPEAARHKAKVGSVQELSIEKIVSLQPQLILANNLTPPQQVEKLRQLGFRVETFGQPASFEDICEHFFRLGRMLGLEKRAEVIVGRARTQVEAVRRAVAPLPRRKVFLQVGAHPLFSSVRKSFTNDFIELGGGVNIAGDQLSGIMKTEQVIALNPALIVIAVMGSENGIGAEEKKHWLSFATIEATRNNQVHVMDPDLVCSPSPPSFANTLVTIARFIHPEAKISAIGPTLQQ